LSKLLCREQWRLRPKEKITEISLTSKLEEYIQQQVRDGLYENPSEVVRMAIHQSVGRDRIFGAAGLAETDISEAAFLVLSMVTRDMDDDIRAVLADIRSMKAWLEKNRTDKKKVEKMIEELMAQLQRGIHEIMQMLDTAVKSNQDTS